MSRRSSPAGAPAPTASTWTHGLFTELQVGSYVFMDDQYNACALTPDAPTPFETSLMIEARVISV